MKEHRQIRQNVVIAGGKTGGHLFPGIAVAQALKKKAPETNILFVGTNAPFETQTLARYKFDHKSIISKPIKGGSLLNKAWSSALVFISLVQAIWILIRFRADFVLGVGGFSSFALVLGARLLGKTTAIQEQNAVPGMTNRLLSKFAHTIFTTFKQTKGMPLNLKTFCVGNPIRQAGPKADPAEPGTDFLDKLSPDDFLILVTGGSQGAASINKAFSKAAAKMQGDENLFIVHQTGKPGEAEIKRSYDSLDLRVEARAFFHNMPAIQKRADLVITRAGASTLSELAIQGKPAILVPFPHAADDHQTANARNLSEKKAAILIADKDLSSGDLLTIIRDLRDHPEKRSQMAENIKSLAMPNGAGIISAHILGTPAKFAAKTAANKGEN